LSTAWPWKKMRGGRRWGLGLLLFDSAAASSVPPLRAVSSMVLLPDAAPESNYCKESQVAESAISL
jgi:hypothetical protein